MPKRFFYVCGGLFFLALSFELGVQRAAAQAAGQFTRGGIDPSNGYFIAVTTDRSVYVANRRNGSDLALDGVGLLPPIPGGSPVVDVARTDGRYGVLAYAILENGDVLFLQDSAGWTTAGNLSGVATSVRSMSWGQVKDRYRK